ncbi:hypothetical protein LOD99_16003 [Oopsacas minuta]|uniref:C2H2-type domain-containing protein n=1 Tax=Oopsacas minuta TaxID=111878 RepID=A0AAV7K5Y8_9METZ|nr:hypothetical protein LOD99_16003 [Oopsacas minuta]
MVRKKRNKEVRPFKGVKLKPLEATQSEDSDSEGPFVSERHFVSCPYCIAKYKTTLAVKSHIRHKHWPKYKHKQILNTTPMCEICGRRYLLFDTLVTHIKYSHATFMNKFRNSDWTNEREFYEYYNRFHCQECGDTFVKPLSYQHHLEKGHILKRTQTRLYCDTKYKTIRHFFKKDTISLANIVTEVKKRSSRDKWSVLAKRHLDTMDQVERFESLF